MGNPPTCWKCGYDLRGLQVTDACPECGTPVWSTPPALGGEPSVEISREAQKALTWGILALVLFLACMGPLAVFLAIPAIVHGNRVGRAVATGRIAASAAGGAKGGLICAWVTVALSVVAVLVYALVLSQ